MTSGATRLAALCLAGGLLVGCSGPEGADEASGGSDYSELVSLFGEWRDFQRPAVTEGVPDYTATAMERQHRELDGYRERLRAIDPSGWSVGQQVDYRLVRAEMDGLEFDHRVLRPWARNPAFYRVIFPSATDVPAREGSVMQQFIRLWEYDFPLSDEEATRLSAELRAIPAILEQARGNLVEEAADLWTMGARVKRRESEVLSELAGRIDESRAELVEDAERARAAVDAFGAWVEEEQADMTAPSGIGIENYDWYLEHVQLVPHTWREEVALVERELGRAITNLALLERRNRELPTLTTVEDPGEYSRRYRTAVSEFIRFLEDVEMFTVPDYAEGALLAQEGTFQPDPDARGFFSQVDYRDPRPMRAHGTHYFDLARMEREPHPSPIRRGPLLYNIWSYRSEGLATAMEELALQAGYLDDSPRAQELIYVLLAQRAARALAALRMHSNDLTLEEAARFASERTPRGWMREGGSTAWTEQALYLSQPGYGSSYVIGKLQLERLLADRRFEAGDDFELAAFMDAFHDSGMIPISLIRWEMTGNREGRVERLQRSGSR